MKIDLEFQEYEYECDDTPDIDNYLHGPVGYTDRKVNTGPGPGIGPGHTYELDDYHSYDDENDPYSLPAYVDSYQKNPNSRKIVKSKISNNKKGRPTHGGIYAVLQSKHKDIPSASSSISSSGAAVFSNNRSESNINSKASYHHRRNDLNSIALGVDAIQYLDDGDYSYDHNSNDDRLDIQLYQGYQIEGAENTQEILEYSDSLSLRPKNHEKESRLSFLKVYIYQSNNF